VIFDLYKKYLKEMGQMRRKITGSRRRGGEEEIFGR
jgi:hypothetical protein